MLANRLSGTMLVSCAGKSCKEAIATAKNMKEYQDAFRVDNSNQSKVDVIINVVADTEDRLIELRNQILNLKGVNGIQLKIGQ